MLGHTVHDLHGNVLRQTLFQNGLGQGCLVAAAEDAGQDLHGGGLLPISIIADHIAPAHTPAVVGGLILAQFVGHGLFAGIHRTLHSRRRNAHTAGEGGQVLILQNGQHGFDVHVAVQQDEGIGGRIEPLMGAPELLIGQLGDHRRIAAGGEPVAGVREEHGHDGLAHHVLGAGVGALHFVEDHALVAGHAVFVELIVPALLVEDLRLLINGRAEHCIQIHPHQIQEILVIPAGNGVAGLVREGHGVEEGVHGVLHQLHEGLLHRIFLRTAEDGMLQNVEHAGAVLRQGGEGNGKGLVVIRALEPGQLCAGGVVLQFVEGTADLRQAPGPDQGEGRVPVHSLFLLSNRQNACGF